MTPREMLDKCREKFPAVVQDLEISGKVETDEGILLNIELYQLMTRDELLLNLASKEKPYVNCDNVFLPEELEDREGKLQDNNLMVYKFSKDNSELILVGTEFDKRQPSLSINFSEYSIFKIFYITPLNFRILENGPKSIFTLMDPIIYYKRIIYEALSKHCSDIHLRCNMTKDPSDIAEMSENFYTAIVDKDGKVKDTLENGLYYEYKVYFRILNDLVYQPQFRFNKSLYESVIDKIVADKTLGVSMDLNTSRGVTSSWLNPLYDGTCNLRISTQKCMGGHDLVARIQTLTTTTLKIDELGFDSKTTECIRDLSTYSSGVLFVTGPVRSGKNTTVNAIVNELKTKPLCMAEYSSPIEIINPFTQIDYNASDSELQGCMEAIKKQDVNIAILNELPKKEIAQSVVDLVNSSVAVITTFHLNRIWHLPYKLQNYFGDDYKTLITSINGVINQKMFVDQCPHCQMETGNLDRLTPFQKKMMKKFNLSTFKFSEGCSQCKHTGLSSSVQPYAEFLIFTKEIKSKLLHCNEPYEMEEVIMDEVTKSQTSLEDSVARGVKEGRLNPSAFDALR